MALRTPEVKVATEPAARSIWLISHPPKISPAGLVSAGMAMVRMVGFPVGGWSVLVIALSFLGALRRAFATMPGSEYQIRGWSGPNEWFGHGKPIASYIHGKCAAGPRLVTLEERHGNRNRRDQGCDWLGDD
ncbi:MAG: hypothetical protein P8X69_10025 [Maritimibacter sp.]